jgi:precorrin-3B methylase
MKFITTDVGFINRHIERATATSLKREKITLYVKLVSSGDTTKFSSTDIIRQVMEALETIEPIK